MSTTSDRLALLQRTKAGQRALLEEMYPDLDFSTVPFREYGRLFTGRRYVPGFVGGWKTYGRSNSEDASTREILPDYSGNGRDIKLYNFGFAGMSGYGGYAQENYSFVANLNNIYSVQSVGTKVVVNRIESSIIPAQSKVLNKNISTGWNLGVVNKIKAGDYGIVIWKTKSGGAEAEILCELAPGDTGTFVNEQTDIDAGLIYIMAGPQIAVPAGQSFSFEFLPTYPGALVSDGIDDYGQCVKGFALPDDYTVVAIRRIIEGHDGGFVSKGSTGGAFIFDSTRENIYSACWSYGVKSTGTPMPSLFSYQMKDSYNGQEISYGTAEDTAEDQLTVFRHGTQLYCKGVLYDLRIYDHTLTAEELQIVRDEMMTDYENATGGGIADIHYVADWDAKGRSNDEEEPMRSQWTDKATGKVINLSNYAYAGMSGWGGYGIDISKVVVNGPQDLVDGNVLQFNVVKNSANFLYGVSGMKSVSARIRVEGISRAVTAGVAYYLQLYFSSSGGERLRIVEDGVHDVDLPVTEGAQWMFLHVAPAISAPDWTPIDPVTVEILPSYPGALVSDGVDDYGVTQEAFNEEVGTMLAMTELNYMDGGTDYQYLLNSGTYNHVGGDRRIFACVSRNNPSAIGSGYFERSGTAPTDVLSLLWFARDPAVTSTPPDYLTICNHTATTSEHSRNKLYRLILIEEELDAAQLEFLKWKVEKEYRDWCRDNGYDYAINQLTA